MQSLLQYEASIRLGCFITILLLMALWEYASPRRPLHLSRLRRWPSNLGIVAVDSLMLRLTMPLLAVGMAAEAETRNWGVFNILETTGWLAGFFSFVLLDLAIYVQHVIFHKAPVLWRLHRMHHTDTDFDVTTGLRFHPLEILLSMGIKIAVVVALGAPVVAVLAFEVALNGSSMFNHGNVGLPARLDRALRLFIVTPEMHRVHHSIYRDETDSNFGFNLPWWDRLFGTYRAQPRDGHLNMAIGLPIFRDRRSVDLHWLLAQPFLNTRTGAVS